MAKVSKEAQVEIDRLEAQKKTLIARGKSQYQIDEIDIRIADLSGTPSGKSREYSH